MSCNEMKPELIGLIYDEIDEKQRERVEAHLSGCDACRQELEALREVSGTIREELGTPVEAPVFLLPRARGASGAGTSAPPAGRPGRWRLAGMAAAVLFAATFVTLAASNTRLERGPDGWSVQFGLMPPRDEAARRIEERLQSRIAELESLQKARETAEPRAASAPITMPVAFQDRLEAQQAETLAAVDRRLDAREREMMRNVSQALDRHSSILTAGFRDQADELMRRNRAVEQFVGNEFNRTRQMLGAMYASAQPAALGPSAGPGATGSPGVIDQ